MSQEGATSLHLALPLPEEISAASSDSDSDSEAGDDILEHSEHIRDAIERVVGSLGGVVGEPIEERIHSRESTSSGRGLGPEVDTQKSSASLPEGAACGADQGCSPGAELVDSLREIVAQSGRRSSRSSDMPGRQISGGVVRRGHRDSIAGATPPSASSRLSEHLRASPETSFNSKDGFGTLGHRRSVSESSVASLSGHRRSRSEGSAPSMSGAGDGANAETAKEATEQSGTTEEEVSTPMNVDESIPTPSATTTGSGGTAAAAAAATAAAASMASRTDSRDSCARTSSRDDCVPEESVMSVSYRLPNSKCPPVVLGASRARKPSGVAEESDDVVDAAPELNLPDMDGILWKKKSNLSKTTKVYRLLRREAKKVFSQGDDWFTGLGNIELAKMYDLASEVIGLIRGEMPPTANADAASAESEGGSWDRRRFRLYGTELTWSKLPSEGHGTDQSLQEVGPLLGGSVEYLGMSSELQGAHIFSLYLPPEVRHRPLTFAAESALDAERWIACLRKACAIPVPGPAPVRPRWEGTADFWNARGPPPEYGPPCAVLHLDVLCASGLSGPDGDDACHNAYIVGCLCGHKFRTVTRYSCSGDVLFGQCVAIPVELEDPDVPVLFSVYDESAFDDQEPLLLGSIAVPLFVFGRGRQLKMVLPLRQETATRSGVVNASFGRLTIHAMLEQPTGHVFLPVEPPQPGDTSASASDGQASGQSQTVNLTDLETQINRIDGLLQMVVGWVTNMAFVLQWERFWWSLAWFMFLQAWTLLFWRWSLTIVALLLLKRTFDIKPKSRFGMLDDGVLHIEPLSSCSGGVEERSDRKPPIHQVSTPAETTLPPRMPSESADMPDAIVWEAERRIIFGGFSAEYLLEGIDPPQWTDDKGGECDPPRTAVLEEGVQMRYHWQVVVNERTDENGWQYAFHFRSDAQWCCMFDTTRTWVRMRARHARRMGPIEVPAESVVFEGANNENPDAYGSQGFLGANVQEGTDQPQHENVISENDLFRRYKQIYLDIRDVIDFWLVTLEKHKNLITWKDETVTNVITVLLFLIFVLSFVVPTRFAVAALVALAFYVGSLMGQRKRRNREIFLEGLSAWCSSNCPTQLRLRGSDRCSVVDDHGIPRLALRNWINSKYGVQLDLRSVAGCPTLRELADLVIEASSKFEKIPRRYRAWHSDVYTNFIDHVPSDATENDVGSICYKSFPSS